MFGDVRGTTGRCTSTIVLVFSDFKKTFWIGFLLLFFGAVPTSNRMKNPEPPQFAFPTAHRRFWKVPPAWQKWTKLQFWKS